VSIVKPRKRGLNKVLPELFAGQVLEDHKENLKCKGSDWVSSRNPIMDASESLEEVLEQVQFWGASTGIETPHLFSRLEEFLLTTRI
jgi:hypothetical protein